MKPKQVRRLVILTVLIFIASNMVFDLLSALTGDSSRYDNSLNNHHNNLSSERSKKGSELLNEINSQNKRSISDNELDVIFDHGSNFNEKRTNEEGNRAREKEKELLAEDSALIHKQFWEVNRWLEDNRSSTELESMADFTANDLKRIFMTRSLWGEARTRPDADKSFDSEYDWRTVAQLAWQYLGAELYPDLISNSTKTLKSIAIRDGFRWWNYKGGRLLECPGSFDNKCEMIDGVRTSNHDAIVTVRDGFHQRNALVPWNTTHIYFILESPNASPNVNFRRETDLLASYWRGSEIPAAYSTWAYYDPKVRSKKQVRDYSEGKTKMAAMFVSNCGAMNNRMSYARELKRYIDVDIYGRCGNKVCNRNNQECFDMLRTDYRFYLAFENSNCRDYITEKFYSNALAHDVIPIVMGGHPSDYKALAPERSYIHVEDYQSPQDLANYLIHLSQNKEAYNSYFEWKGTGEFIGTHFFCRICSMLWYSDLNPPPKLKKPWSWSRYEMTSGPGCSRRRAWYWKKRDHSPKP